MLLGSKLKSLLLVVAILIFLFLFAVLPFGLSWMVTYENSEQADPDAGKPPLI